MAFHGLSCTKSSVVSAATLYFLVMASCTSENLFFATERRSADAEETWLRVARWQLWNRNQKGAVLATRRVLALNAKSIR